MHDFDYTYVLDRSPSEYNYLIKRAICYYCVSVLEGKCHVDEDKVGVTTYGELLQYFNKLLKGKQENYEKCYGKSI